MISKKKIILSLILVVLLVSCVPYKQDEILCEYKETNCLYYTKDEYKKYKYSDFIVDDVINGEYLKATPNIANFRTGNGVLDYDIPAYVNARMDYAIKNELIKKYESVIEDICIEVHDGYFNQKNSYIYFFDKGANKKTLLINKPATNISYDDEMPLITFDTEPEDINEQMEKLKGRKIKLSDIIASNTTLDGFMKVILGTGKEKHKFYMDRELFDIATSSEIAVK